MKKLILIVSLLFAVFVSYGQQMTIINHPTYIEILDSNSVDTTYAPIYLFKDNITYIKTVDQGAQSGALKIYINEMKKDPDVVLNHSDFNQFSNNDELRTFIINSLVTRTDTISFIFDCADISGTDTTLYLYSNTAFTNLAWSAEFEYSDLDDDDATLAIGYSNNMTSGTSYSQESNAGTVIPYTMNVTINSYTNNNGDTVATVGFEKGSMRFYWFCVKIVVNSVTDGTITGKIIFGQPQ